MTGAKYDIDVVILSWNRAADTIECIRSTLSQVGINVYIRVIDQGSEKDCLDSLYAAVSDLENVKIYELGRNYGVPGGRNRGIALGNSEVIVCIDNDAVFEDEKNLLRVVEKFNSSRELGVIGFRIENYQSRSISPSDWVYPKSLFARSLESFYATRYCGAGHAIKRKAFDAASGYDEKLFFYWEELDLSYKIINNGFDIIYDPSIVILHKTNIESRVEWGERRYYYLVRNALYIDWKYIGSIGRLLLMAAGYFVKGFYNKLYRQTLMGVVDGVLMCVSYTGGNLKLNRDALNYIYKHDVVHRGGFIDRIRREIFVKII